MPAKRSNLICPKCKKIGGFIQKRWVKRTANLPSEKNIISISRAWEYGARVCLRNREMLILFPPSTEEDGTFAKKIYNEFDFGQHTEREMKSFESNHLFTESKNAMKKKAELTSQLNRIRVESDGSEVPLTHHQSTGTIHTELPNDTGRVMKSSVAFLYASIICLIFKDITANLPTLNPGNKLLTSAITAYFGLLRHDLRNSETIFSWMSIFEDIARHGYHAAAAMNSIRLFCCKSCSDRRNKVIVKMEETLEGDAILRKCSKCGSREQLELKVALTTKHLGEMHKNGHMSRKAQDIIDYLPLFQDKVKGICRSSLNRNKQQFRLRFLEYELLAKNDLLFKTESYFIGHYDASKKWKRRWCHIPIKKLGQIKLNHSDYKKTGLRAS